MHSYSRLWWEIVPSSIVFSNFVRAQIFMEAQGGQSLFYLCSEYPSPARAKSHTWEHTLGKEQHVHLHAGHNILFSLWFLFSGKWKVQPCPEKIPAMLYSWDYLVVPNVTGVYSPASPKESKLPPDWTVWGKSYVFLSWLCTVGPWLLLGVLALPFTTTALGQTSSCEAKRKERMAVIREETNRMLGTITVICLLQ